MTQSISHTAKPIGYYVSNRAIGFALAQNLGDYFENLTAQQKCLFGAVIYDHMASSFESYGMTESLCSVDPDRVLGDRMWAYIEHLAEDSTAIDFSELQAALAAYVADHARAGDFEP